MSQQRSTPRLSGDDSRRASGDQGYVIALTALLIIPLMAFTALAVDVGAWYGRAAQIQRASDAAALAGVWQLPDLTSAKSVACDTLARNGFPNASGDCPGTSTAYVATIAQVPDLTYKLKVDLRDTKATQYFSKLFKPSVDIGRYAIGQYVKPTTMGSARNFLGTGNIGTGAACGGSGEPACSFAAATAYNENFWLAVSGGCSSKEQGERFTAVSDANYAGTGNPDSSPGSSTCSPSGTHPVANVEYDCAVSCPATTPSSASYYYGVQFSPTYVPASQTVEVYSPSANCSSSAREDDSGGGSTTFQMLNPGANPTTASNYGAALAGGTSSTGANCGWVSLPSFTPAANSTWYIKVTPSSTGAGSNSFAFRVRGSGAWSTSSACSSDAADSSFTFSDQCPNVFGYGSMGVYANQDGGGTGTVADFYLAQTLTADNGKQMQVDLWDPGEGARTFQILDPLNNPMPFTWSVLCWNPNNSFSDGTCTDSPPNGGTSGSSSDFNIQPGCNVASSAPCAGAATFIDEGLDILGYTRWNAPSDNVAAECTTIPCQWDTSPPAGTAQGGGWNVQPGPYRTSASKYNDRLLRIVVQLPANIASSYSCGAGCYRSWWKIRYRTGASSVTDRTTWAVTMKGSPIRLVPA